MGKIIEFYRSATLKYLPRTLSSCPAEEGTVARVSPTDLLKRLSEAGDMIEVLVITQDAAGQTGMATTLEEADALLILKQTEMKLINNSMHTEGDVLA